MMSTRPSRENPLDILEEPEEVSRTLLIERSGLTWAFSVIQPLEVSKRRPFLVKKIVLDTSLTFGAVATVHAIDLLSSDTVDTASTSNTEPTVAAEMGKFYDETCVNTLDSYLGASEDKRKIYVRQMGNLKDGYRRLARLWGSSTSTSYVNVGTVEVQFPKEIPLTNKLTLVAFIVQPQFVGLAYVRGVVNVKFYGRST